ncbi:MAG: sigma-70 family RNA polymerase sigma factor, partial [Ruminiclostridium sp.]|nr:sigma-70 family RNA polymerase sigma factor [Ruminiclostridium sp.]
KVTINRFCAEVASHVDFVRAWIKLNSLKDRTKFGSWVCAIAKNHAVSLVRHYRNASSDVCFELLENIDLNETQSEIISFYEQERDESLHETVEALSEKIRETVKLHYFEEMSVEEIAKRQNIPQGTVKWRLAEGRKRLRKEYGVMDINSNGTLVQKVMEQVEQLKSWNLKKDKTGFENVYRQLLKTVEDLEESPQKHHAMAEVLARGYWWLDGENNDEMFMWIKSAAEKSLNEDIMSFVITAEWNKYKGNERREYMENVQAPYLIQKGFKKSLSYLYFWLAYECCVSGHPENGIGYFKKVMDILPKSNEFYAVASGAVHIEERRLREGKTPYSYGTNGAVLEYKDNKLLIQYGPGYQQGGVINSRLFYNCACCDGIMYDESMKEGESFTSSTESMRFVQLRDGEVITPSEEGIKVTCKSKNAVVKTPCGIYENCICYVCEGDHYGLKYCETYFCRGVGIVKQIVDCHGRREEWQLAKCTIKGGDEIIPFSEGNRWEYCLVQDTDKRFDTENVFEIVYTEEEKAVFQSYTYVKALL